MTRFCFISAASVFVVFYYPAMGQDPQKNYIEVTKWIAEVLNADGSVAIELGVFDTFNDAAGRTTAWSKEHPNDFRQTNERERVFKKYLDKPPKQQESPTSPSRKPNDIPSARTPANPSSKQTPHPGASAEDKVRPTINKETNRPPGVTAEQNGRPSESRVNSIRDPKTGGRYISPDALYVVTLHDGRTFKFQSRAEALKYMHKINENPDWRATLREVGRTSTGSTENPAERNDEIASPSPPQNKLSKEGLIDKTILASNAVKLYKLNDDGTVYWYYKKSNFGTWELSGDVLTIRIDSYGRKGISGYGGAQIVTYRALSTSRLSQQSHLVDGRPENILPSFDTSVSIVD